MTSLYMIAVMLAILIGLNLTLCSPMVEVRVSQQERSNVR